jgi:hypothetical protein
MSRPGRYSRQTKEAEMEARIQIVLDCAEPHRQADFWAEALHYEREVTDGDDWDAIHDPGGNGPRVYLQKVPEPKVAKNRMHIDLGVSGGAGVTLEERKRQILAEVERLKALGASDARGPMENAGEYWFRMNDPEGNEFCVQ